MGKTLRSCVKGHQYYKSSDCPTCPICEAEQKPTAGWMAKLSSPAQRALAGAGIKTLQDLATYSEKELLKLHGFGKASLPPLRQALATAGLNFKH